VVLGGRHLGQYYAVYVNAGEVRDINAGVQSIDREWFQRRFAAIDNPEYAGARGDEYFDYTWTNVTDVQVFYVKATKASSRHFTATWAKIRCALMPQYRAPPTRQSLSVSAGR
jgi:hypothetical protein